jgi:hypothetical protein
VLIASLTPLDGANSPTQKRKTHETGQMRGLRSPSLSSVSCHIAKSLSYNAVHDRLARVGSFASRN